MNHHLPLDHLSTNTICCLLESRRKNLDALSEGNDSGPALSGTLFSVIAKCCRHGIGFRLGKKKVALRNCLVNSEGYLHQLDVAVSLISTNGVNPELLTRRKLRWPCIQRTLTAFVPMIAPRSNLLSKVGVISEKIVTSAT